MHVIGLHYCSLTFKLCVDFIADGVENISEYKRMN